MVTDYLLKEVYFHDHHILLRLTGERMEDYCNKHDCKLVQVIRRWFTWYAILEYGETWERGYGV